MKTKGWLVILVAIAALQPMRPAHADDFVQPIALREMVASRLIASMVLSPDGQSIAGIGIARGDPRRAAMPCRR